MKALFGSKKEEPPKQPAFDPSNKEQLKEIEKEYKKKLQKEMRELERGVLRNAAFPRNSLIFSFRKRHDHQEGRKRAQESFKRLQR